MTSHTDAMRAALEPFAKVAEDRALDGQVADDSVTIGLMNGYITQTVIYGKLTVADFRRARAALSAPPASAGGGERVDLEEIEKRLNAADGFPWRYEKRGQTIWGFSRGGSAKTESDYMVADIRGWGHLQYMGKTRGDGVAAALQDANGELIGHAPTDMRALLSEVRRLRAKAGEEEA